MDCIFCKIARKEIPSSIVYEDDKLLVFEDLEPQAPVHLLIIPKIHIESLDEMREEDIGLIGYITYTAAKIAREKNLVDGYRLVINCKEDGGQTVGHLHYHLLGGRSLQWPPG